MPEQAAAPVQPPPTTPAPEAPKPAPVAETPNWQEQYAKKVREHVADRRKWESQQREMNPKIQRLAEIDKREALAKLNPPEYLKSIYGEKWYDTIVESKLNGAPPADVVAAEISKVKEEFQSELAKRDAAERERTNAAEKAQQSATLRSLRDDMSSFFHASKDSYPALDARFENPEAVGNAIFAHIQAHWEKTAVQNEQGRYVGKPLSYKEAADALETRERAFAKKLAAHEKLSPEFRELLTPKQINATLPKQSQLAPSQSQGQNSQSQDSQSQARRTLSNDITGSTQGQQAPASRAERWERAIEKHAEMRRR